MAKHKTKRKRNKRSKLKVSFAKMRDDAERHNVISTTPEGAVRNERVDPALQDSQRFPGLDRAAIKDALGWTVPDSVKRKVIEVAAEMVHERVIDFVDDGQGGKVAVERPNRKAQVEGAKILLSADETQYKRDEPEKAGKAAGAAQIDWSALQKPAEQLDEPEAKIVEVRRMIATPEQEPHVNGDGK